MTSVQPEDDTPAAGSPERPIPSLVPRDGADDDRADAPAVPPEPRAAATGGSAPAGLLAPEGGPASDVGAPPPEWSMPGSPSPGWPDRGEGRPASDQIPGADGDPGPRPASLPGLRPSFPEDGSGSRPPDEARVPRLGTDLAPVGGLAGGLAEGGGDPGPGPGHRASVDRRLFLAAVGLVVVLVIALGVVLVAGVGGDSKDSATAAGSKPPAGTPAAPGGEAGNQPAGDPAEALRSLLNPVVMTGCTVPERSDSAYADASLVCKDSSGVEVSAFHYPSQSAVDRQIGAREAFYSDAGNCDDGQPSSERWNTPQEPAGGTRLCYFFAQRFYEFWTYDRGRIALSASSADPKEINTWWHSFDPIRR